MTLEEKYKPLALSLAAIIYRREYNKKSLLSFLVENFWDSTYKSNLI